MLGAEHGPPHFGRPPQEELGIALAVLYPSGFAQKKQGGPEMLAIASRFESG
jgi:hypothetical protein